MRIFKKEMKGEKRITKDVFSSKKRGGGWGGGSGGRLYIQTDRYIV